MSWRAYRGEQDFEVWGGVVSARRGAPSGGDTWIPCEVLEFNGEEYYLVPILNGGRLSALTVRQAHVRKAARGA